MQMALFLSSWLTRDSHTGDWGEGNGKGGDEELGMGNRESGNEEWETGE